MPKEDKNSAIKKEVNPLDLLNENDGKSSKVVENIVNTETSTGERILGDAPEIDMSLLEDFVPPKNYTLIALKWLNVVMVAAFLLGFLFFTFQTTKVFGFVHKAFTLEPPYIALEQLNKEVLEVKTQENLARHRMLKVAVDRLTYLGDAYKQAFKQSISPTTSNSEKLDAREKMALLESEIKPLVREIAMKYAVPLEENLVWLDDKNNTVEFSTALKEQIGEQISELGQENSIEARILDQMKENVVNGALKSQFTTVDIENLTEEEMVQFLENVAAEANNDFTSINLVKNQRVNWSEVMNEIEQRTIAVDNYFSDEFFDELGGIRYTSYDFDSENRRLTLLGDTRSFETTNFSMIANLIDELNRSEMFSNAEMNSFNKTGSFAEGYNATLKVTMDLDE